MAAVTNAAAINVEKTLLRMGPPAPMVTRGFRLCRQLHVGYARGGASVYLEEAGLERGGRREHGGYLTQSSQRTESLVRRWEPAPAGPAHGSRGTPDHKRQRPSYGA